MDSQRTGLPSWPPLNPRTSCGAIPFQTISIPSRSDPGRFCLTLGNVRLRITKYRNVIDRREISSFSAGLAGASRDHDACMRGNKGVAPIALTPESTCVLLPAIRQGPTLATPG